MYVATCMSNTVICYFLFPETKNKTLEELGEIFVSSWTVTALKVELTHRATRMYTCATPPLWTRASRRDPWSMPSLTTMRSRMVSKRVSDREGPWTHQELDDEDGVVVVCLWKMYRKKSAY